VGKLYDDKGNRMSPSFSSKNGVHYRFYVSSALLRGRKEAAASVAWTGKAKDTAIVVHGKNSSEGECNEGLIQLMVRSHVWAQSLRDDTHDSIEALAEANNIHPKVVRQALRLAFLAPDITSAILEGKQPAELPLARIPKLLPPVLERAPTPDELTSEIECYGISIAQMFACVDFTSTSTVSPLGNLCRSGRRRL
jgi:site-specific DNA recombinase